MMMVIQLVVGVIALWIFLNACGPAERKEITRETRMVSCDDQQQPKEKKKQDKKCPPCNCPEQPSEPLPPPVYF